MITKQKRPKFLNLLKIHLPVTGVNSIAHRISGLLLFMAVPILIYVYGLSLKSAESFNKIADMLNGSCGKIILSLLAWAVGHHLLAGIRFLLIDINLGADLSRARTSAWLVNIAGIIVFMFLAYKIWL